MFTFGYKSKVNGPLRALVAIAIGAMMVTQALPVWWAYSIALGVFMFILPFSRYMHIPAEILLIPMRNAGIPIRYSRKGISRLQVYSCPGCGVCIDACPLSAAKANIKDTTVYLNRQLKRNNKKRIAKQPITSHPYLLFYWI